MTCTELAVRGGTESGNVTTGAVTEDDSGNAFCPRSYTKLIKKARTSQVTSSARRAVAKVASRPEDTGSQTKEGHQSRIEDEFTLTLGASEQIFFFCVIQDRVVKFLLSWTRMARLKTCRLRAVPRHGPTKTQVLLTFASSTKDYNSVPRCLIC